MHDRQKAPSPVQTSERARVSQPASSLALRSPPSASDKRARRKTVSRWNTYAADVRARQAASQDDPAASEQQPALNEPISTAPSPQPVADPASPQQAEPSLETSAPSPEASLDTAPPETAPPEQSLAPADEVNAPPEAAAEAETDTAPPLDYQPIDSSIASRFEQCTGENVSGVLIAENPALLDQGKRGVAKGHCIEVVPGCLHDIALCAHELTHIVQQRGSSNQKEQNKNNQLSTELEAEKSETLIKDNKKFKITVRSSEENLYDDLDTSDDSSSFDSHKNCEGSSAGGDPCDEKTIDEDVSNDNKNQNCEKLLNDEKYEEISSNCIEYLQSENKKCQEKIEEISEKCENLIKKLDAASSHFNNLYQNNCDDGGSTGCSSTSNDSNCENHQEMQSKFNPEIEESFSFDEIISLIVSLKDTLKSLALGAYIGTCISASVIVPGSDAVCDALDLAYSTITGDKNGATIASACLLIPGVAAAHVRGARKIVSGFEEIVSGPGKTPNFVPSHTTNAKSSSTSTHPHTSNATNSVNPTPTTSSQSTTPTTTPSHTPSGEGVPSPTSSQNIQSPDTTSLTHQNNPNVNEITTTPSSSTTPTTPSHTPSVGVTPSAKSLKKSPSYYEPKPGTPMKDKTIGHAFKKHGSHNEKELKNIAKGSGIQQGQWLNDEEAEKLIASHLESLKSGAKIVSIPKGLGRIHNPDGTFTDATHAILVPRGSGVSTAFPCPPTYEHAKKKK